MSEQNKTLYERLGGYDAIAAVANDLVAGSTKILNSVVSGRIAEKTASSVRSNFLLISCASTPVDRSTTGAEKCYWSIAA